jgi:hypothetical protein
MQLWITQKGEANAEQEKTRWTWSLTKTSSE